MNKDFAVKRLLDVKEVCEYCGIGVCNAREWCKTIGAERRIGRRVLYDRLVIDAEIDKIGRGEGTVAPYVYPNKTPTWGGPLPVDNEGDRREGVKIGGDEK